MSVMHLPHHHATVHFGLGRWLCHKTTTNKQNTCLTFKAWGAEFDPQNTCQDGRLGGSRSWSQCWEGRDGRVAGVHWPVVQTQYTKSVRNPASKVVNGVPTGYIMLYYDHIISHSISSFQTLIPDNSLHLAFFFFFFNSRALFSPLIFAIYI